MRKFLINTTKFLLFTSVFYIALLCVWEQAFPSWLKPNINYKVGANGHLYTRLSEIKKYSNIDILFLGSSHAYRGFDTRIFSKNGLKSFNLGSSSQTPIQTKILIDRYLDQLNPKLVIYEVYPDIFSLDGVESSLDLIANGKNDFHTIKMALEINSIRTYNTLIYGFIRELLGLNKSYIEPTHKDNDTYIPGGFVEKKLGFYSPQKLDKKEIKINPKQLKYFNEIIDKIKSKNIEVILVYAPIPKINYKRYTNTKYFDEIMRKYSTYYNFNEIVSLNDSLHFFDSHHLNLNGVEIFNNKLIELLKDSGVLKRVKKQQQSKN
ncbi:hypothetical protein [Tenuifilum thalassicum]|uniref:SGNH/GDSL hydrolase family protein n=1 Tax=Tenuifilum thalassicum TaxID=2590900 RepID=A0A7D3XKE8_9BACT|nr:hypothetical protein [Tenuifilum thalassicum]QKG79770.1 hypothetical protein FHG85_05675 [Tenuifilum thalassicum]